MTMTMSIGSKIFMMFLILMMMIMVISSTLMNFIHPLMLILILVVYTIMNLLLMFLFTTLSMYMYMYMIFISIIGGMMIMLTMIMLTMIISSTLIIMINMIKNKLTNRFLLKNHSIEIIWTITPMLMLMTIAIPSMKTLYFFDELWNPFFTIKSMGHQWYWSYEYPDINNIEFSSYMINETENMNMFRLLDVDNRMVAPFKIPIRLITSSTDVIHSWTIPSLGMKMDATPGRINQMTMYSSRPGLFYGQCSEICGSNHSFMPIVLESTSIKNFKNWLNSFQ